MLQVYSAGNPTDAHFVKGFLESHGIKCCIKGEALFFMRGKLPITTDTAPSVWIFDKQQMKKAALLITELTSSDSTFSENESSWTCELCGETLERQFTHCWNCNAEKPK